MIPTVKPLVIDLFCGLGGWSEAFIAEGYRAIGFDIEAHDYGSGGYPGELVLKDIRSINGADLVAEYGVPACIVASPPCQKYSYMAMPWSRAKKLMAEILADTTDKKTEELNDLFNQCFRIQREVSAAAGAYVPLVVENVRGAQKWVGRSRWNFRSFHLWGDVPALMPIPCKFSKVPDFRFDGSGRSFQTAAVKRDEGNKTTGMNWGDDQSRGKNIHNIPGRKRGVSFTDVAGFASGVKVSSENGRRADNGKDMKIHMRYSELKEGAKGFTPNGEPLGKNTLGRMHSSKSKARKQASAEIAKIPPTLAQWIARTFKPKK